MKKTWMYMYLHLLYLMMISMSSIRGIKKVLKNSKGFCTVICKDSMCACISEWDTIKYHKHGVSVSDSVYVPYKLIKEIGL